MYYDFRNEEVKSPVESSRIPIRAGSLGSGWFTKAMARRLKKETGLVGSYLRFDEIVEFVTMQSEQ
jgi:hypothetical protein